MATLPILPFLLSLLKTLSANNSLFSFLHFLESRTSVWLLSSKGTFVFRNLPNFPVVRIRVPVSSWERTCFLENPKPVPVCLKAKSQDTGLPCLQFGIYWFPFLPFCCCILIMPQDGAQIAANFSVSHVQVPVRFLTKFFALEVQSNIVRNFIRDSADLKKICQSSKC